MKKLLIVSMFVLLALAVTQQARANFSTQTDFSNEVSMFLDNATNTNSVTGHVGGQSSTDVVNIVTVGTVDAASGNATIKQNTGLLTSLTFTPVNPNLFSDFDFHAQFDAAGDFIVTVFDNKGDGEQTITFNADRKNADLGPFGIISTDGETIQWVKITFPVGSANSFNQVKQIDFSYANGGPSVTPVPEPGTLLLLGFGLIGLAGVARRRMK